MNAVHRWKALLRPSREPKGTVTPPAVTAARIAGIYFLAAAAWISLSDHVLASLGPDDLTRYQTLKGWAFVLATSLLLFLLVWRTFRSRRRLENERRESARFFSTLAENLPGVVYRCRNDRDWTMEYLSEGVRSLTGFWVEDFAPGGIATWGGLILPEDRDRVWQDVQAALDAEEPFLLEYRIRTRAGEARCVWERGCGVYSEDGDLVALEGVIHDITTRKAAEEALRRQYRNQDALYALAEDLSRDLDPERRIERIVRACVERFGATGAALLEVRDDGEVLVLGRHPEPEQKDVPEDATDEAVRRALRARTPGIGSGGRTNGDGAPPEICGPDARSWATFPLTSRDRSFGALVVWSEEEGFFGADEREFLETLSHHAATSLTNGRLFRETERRVSQLRALRAIDMAITGSLDLRVTLNVILEQVTSQLAVDAAAILLVDRGSRMLEHAAGRGFRTTSARGARLRLDDGKAVEAAVKRKVVWIPDLRAHPEAFRRQALVREEKFVSYMAVPLVAKGHVLGVLEMFHRGPLERNPEWEDFLDALAGQAAIALDNAGLFRELEQANEELVVAYDETIEGWARALDLRDHETEGHSRRVTELTLRLARAMGIEGERLAHVRRGALLHDIGKMGVPDAILLKPGPLDDEEREVMKRHPVYAHRLLSPIPFLREALEIPYCHHEKWDGTGYPRGLKGKEIPLPARIFAVADVWDALRSDRPYREAWSEDRALAHMREQAGAHFDPEVVRVFLELIEEETVAEPIRLVGVR